jgi:coenzyme Q-binding protein COQ10
MVALAWPPLDFPLLFIQNPTPSHAKPGSLCLMPTHTETKVLPYTADQMYALVADVEKYPKFLPWNAAARIRSRKPMTGANGAGEVMEADLVISFKVFRERFGSRVVLWPEARKIDTEYLDGPFRYMKSNWTFRERAEGGCEVDFHVDFEFRNAILQGIIGVVFNEAMQRVVRAFERRAAELYGRAG